MAEKPDESTQNGEIFDREAYLRDVEQFEDVEVVVAGRNSVKIDRKAVSLFQSQVPHWTCPYELGKIDESLVLYNEFLKLTQTLL